MTSRLPSQPLVAAFDDFCRRNSLTDKAASLRLGWEISRIYSMRRRPYVTWQTADRCAVQLGYHPGSLWPEEWFS